MAASYVTHEELVEVLNGLDERLNGNFCTINKRLDGMDKRLHGIELMLCMTLTPEQRSQMCSVAPELQHIIDRVEG